MDNPYRTNHQIYPTKEEVEMFLIPHSSLGEEYIFWTKYPNLSRIIEIYNIDQILKINLIGGVIKFITPPKQKWINFWTEAGHLSFIRYERFL